MSNNMKKVQILAEIGINHNGDLNIAKQLIDVAKTAGADAVKFQKRNPDVCVPEDQKKVIRQTPWGEMTYLEYRHKVEFGIEEYNEIDRYCRERGIEWFASVWDLDSLEFMLQYKPKNIKIPSALLTQRDLVQGIAKKGIHTYISTGMSNLEEIDWTVNVFRSSRCPFSLMHCTSSYPAPTEELNLLCINALKERYNCSVGYSGHEYGLIGTLTAVSLGAESVERHITLDHRMWGSDHFASVEPPGFMKLVRYIHSISASMGDGVKRVLPSEIPIRKKLRGC